MWDADLIPLLPPKTLQRQFVIMADTLRRSGGDRCGRWLVLCSPIAPGGDRVPAQVEDGP